MKLVVRGIVRESRYESFYKKHEEEFRKIAPKLPILTFYQYKKLLNKKADENNQAKKAHSQGLESAE